MRIIKSMAAIAAIFTAVAISAAANGIDSGKAFAGTDNSQVSEANILVKVIKQKNGVKTTVYTGPLYGYEDGALIGMDFSKMQLAVVFNWDSADYDTMYIAPVTAAADINTPSNASIYQTNVVNTELADTNIRVSLLYDNAYSESVLLPGEELTAEIYADNTGGGAVDISALLALYDENGRLISAKEEREAIEESGEGRFYNKIVVPDDSTAASAKIMLWDNLSGMKPYASPLILTAAGADFFGDDYSIAQPITGKNKVSGRINTAEDTDVFSFVPKNSGLYYFEAFSDIDTYASLYAAGSMSEPIASDDNSGADNNFRLSATLTANETYYLYVNGRQEGGYSLNYGYAIGDIFGTVSPVKFYDDDSEFNALSEAAADIYAYRTGEFVASMHLKDWSGSNSAYASFSMTGIHSGEYLVKIRRAGYLTLYKKITLSDNAVDLGSVTLIAGDVNADNIVDEQDISIVTELIGTQYGDENYLINADINADKVIDSSDLALVSANLNKNSNHYNTNVNVIIMDADIYDNQLIVSGRAAPNSTLSCNIYYDGYSVFDGEAACSESGGFQITAELNRSGKYIIGISDGDYAYEFQREIEY